VTDASTASIFPLGLGGQAVFASGEEFVAALGKFVEEANDVFAVGDVFDGPLGGIVIGDAGGIGTVGAEGTGVATHEFGELALGDLMDPEKKRSGDPNEAARGLVFLGV
jgi:hypothetical protein